MRTAEAPTVQIFAEDCIAGMSTRLTAESVSVVVTSPPYNLRKRYLTYEDDQKDGDYLAWLGRVASGVLRVLDRRGSFFLNLGSKPSDPWWPMRVADKVRSQGFVLQNTILWVKSIAISKKEVGNYPSIVGDISVGHYKPVNSRRYLNGLSEYIFHFTKHGDVDLDKLGIGVPYQDKSNVARWGSSGVDLHDRGNVWFIPYETIQRSRRHPCVFPVKLPERCIRLHGVKKTRLVLDPFVGTGSTALAADRLGVGFIGFDIDPSYARMARENIRAQQRARNEFLKSNPQADHVPWERLGLATGF